MSDPNYLNANSSDQGNSTQLSVYFTCGLVALLILLLDMVTPLGGASGILYIAVVLLSLRSPVKRFTIMVAAICTLLVGIGYMGSPPSDIPLYQVVANRLLAVASIWTTAILALIQQGQTEALHQARLQSIHSNREIEIREEKLKVLKATMRTVQDITGNFLNSLQFIHLEIDKTQTLSPESIKKLDGLIQDTSLRINKLGDLEEIREKKMAGNMIGIDYEHTLKNESTIRKSN